MREDVFAGLPPQYKQWKQSNNILRGLGGVPQNGFGEATLAVNIDNWTRPVIPLQFRGEIMTMIETYNKTSCSERKETCPVKLEIVPDG